MADHELVLHLDEAQFEAFMKSLLDDVQALDRMLEAGMIESGVRRIGAEQEMFLVNKNLLPAPISREVLETIDDPRFTTELAKFNLEANLTPQRFGPGCLTRMEEELQDIVRMARQKTKDLDADVLLVGILPTLDKSNLTLDYLTDAPRYHQMNDALTRFRRGEFQVAIRGLDELTMTHDNILLEACNTSFQVHFQVGPQEFPNLYNLAQVVTAPVLAAGVNAPALLGKRLWQETRIALFQHAVDTRSPIQKIQGHLPRVHFGEHWVEESVLELFREDIARFRLLMARRQEENSLEVLDQGGVPQLSALSLHTRSIWRWNRACYGIGADGKPHLRIENRALPSGPTVLDEMANAAFFFGLMAAFSYQYVDIKSLMPFYDAKTNFFMAARHGLKAQFTWLDGKNYSAQDLILNELLPVARGGLRDHGVTSDEVDRYLGTIEERVRQNQTGSQWILDSLEGMGNQGTLEARFRSVTAAMLKQQKTDTPVHCWEKAELVYSQDHTVDPGSVEAVMTPHPFAVGVDDVIDVAADLHQWEHRRYVPVQDAQGNLAGMVFYYMILQHLVEHPGQPLPVRDVMWTNLVTVLPETLCTEAICLMREHRIGCLPVVRNGKLLGILTERDLIALAGDVLAQSDGK